MKEEFYSYSQMALGVEVYFTRIGDFTWRVVWLVAPSEEASRQK